MFKPAQHAGLTISIKTAVICPKECDDLVATFREINQRESITILLIEHVMRAVMALAEKIIVLHHGEVIAHGTPGQVVKEPAVLECYLGEETEI